MNTVDKNEDARRTCGRGSRATALVVYGIASLIASCIVVSWFFLPLCADAARAGVRPAIQGDGITIYFDSSLRENAEILLRAYPAMKADLEAKLGWRLRTKPVVFLVASSGKFRKMGGGPLDAAFTLFPKGHIVMNFDSFTPHLFLLNITFRHELCHLLLHDHIQGKYVPKWLDEGVSEWAGDTAEEDINSRMEGVAMAYALSKRAVPLEEISRKFPSDAKGRTLSYEQSKSVIRFIAASYGREGLLQVLAQLKNGVPVGEAFHEALGKNLATVEAEWREDNLRRVRWILRAEDLMAQIGAQISRMAAFVSTWYRKIHSSFGSLSAEPFTSSLPLIIPPHHSKTILPSFPL